MAETELQAASGGDHRIIEIDGDLSDSVMQKLQSLENALIKNPAGADSCKPKTPRVPIKLRAKQDLKKYFEPRVVSIGPYHHQKTNLKVTEKMKIQLAAKFIQLHGVQTQELFRTIKGKIEDLKKCYEVDAISKCEYDNDELTWIFLLDGCVVLHFLCFMDLWNKKDDNFKEMEIVLAVTDKSTFERDIMLLENQLPYQLLDTLIGSTRESERKNLEKVIQMFICRKSWNPLPPSNQALEQENTSHLLDLLRSSLIMVDQTNDKYSVQEWTIKKSLMKIIGMPFYILMCLIRFSLYLILPHRPDEFLSLNNFEELKEAGFEIKPNYKSSSADVEYSDGTLLLPFIVVDCEILNLIAYEIGVYDDSLEFKVSAYIFFLASLIDGPEHVKELQAKKILYNRLGSDEEVFKLFKEIENSLIDDLEVAFPPKYARVFWEIDYDYEKGRYRNKRKYRLWMDQLNSRYLDTPWSVIGLLAATILLVLTFIQTFYAVLGHRKGQS